MTHNNRDNGNIIRVEYGGETLEVLAGTTISELLGQLFIQQNRIVGATLNHHLVSLETAIDGHSQLEAVACDSREGQAILRRTLTHLFHYVVRSHSPQLRVMIGQSLLGGYYYDIQGEVADLEEWSRQITAHMQEVIEQNLPFLRRTISVEAVEHWVDDPHGFKKSLLQAWPSPQIRIISLGDQFQISHGPCAPTTGCLRGSRVTPYDPGIVLNFPEAAATSPLPAADAEGRKLFNAYRETRAWNELVGISSVGDLTSAALQGGFDDVVRMAEALHEKKIAEIADQICARQDQVRMVCIAGPSASGKTTFLQRLSVHLRVNGLHPLTLNLDDFYAGRAQAPLDPDGQPDFEALEALDLIRLEQTLDHLFQGHEVSLPRYDFRAGRPVDPACWRRVRLQPGQVIVIEGIHGLNPALCPRVPRAQRYNLFVSALTQLIIDEHNRIFTSDLRLLRRIVRDRRQRGFSALDTIQRWPAVRRGEENNIFPYQEHSDAIFNSTLVYEVAVLKPLAWRYLLEVPRDHPSRVRAYELLKFLELFVPVFSEAIPANSVLREFIGGSGFRSDQG